MSKKYFERTGFAVLNRARTFSPWFHATFIALALLTLHSSASKAQVVTEFSAGISTNTDLYDITAGPDGNLWFTEQYGNRIGRMTPVGVVTEFNASGFPLGITAGPDGNVWFTEGVGRIGRITPLGVITEFGTDITQPQHITTGPDGNLWFTDYSFVAPIGRIGRITPSGVVTEFSAGISAGARPFGIAAGPDGNLWFTESSGSRIGKITPSGVVTEFTAGISQGVRISGITAGPDGNLWFTESYPGNGIGRITTLGVVTEFSAGISTDAGPWNITKGPDGNLWFTEGALDRIGRITPLGVVTEFTAGISTSTIPGGITSGPDGNLWFLEGELCFPGGPDGGGCEPGTNEIGRITTGLPVTLTVPIVLSSSGGSAFTSELTLTNRGTTDSQISCVYTPAFGGMAGVATDTLPAGEQRVIPDAIVYLERLGISNPGAGGTLAVTFSNLSFSGAASALVRTTTPVPGGRAGLDYAGLPLAQLLASPVYLCGLRQNTTDRSNVAVLNAGAAGDGDITLRLTVFSGDPGYAQSQVLPDVTLSPGAFAQISGILRSNGLSLSNGYVKVEQVSGSAPFYAYGVINDNVTSDGSLIPRVFALPLLPISSMTLPVLVETTAYSTELILTNFSAFSRTLDFTWVAPQLTGGPATFSISLLPGEQQILPAFVQLLRDRGVVTDPPGGPFAGALFVTDESGTLQGVSIAARVTTASGNGGRYGVFVLAFPSGTEATTSAWLFGLQQNAETRSNLALVNTGSTDTSSSTFRIDIFDGASGAEAGSLVAIVPAKGFVQIDRILADYAPGTTDAYALVTRISGNNPFIPYAVLNDGAQPGERSGDGAFIGPTVPAP